MTTLTASVPTTNGGKYIRQLCKHWSHKLQVEVVGDRGVVHFPDAVATMDAGADAIAISLTADDAATVDRFRNVLEIHLDRFAFREAPLSYEWQ